MISQTVEYALRAVVSLAHWHDAPRTAGQLAEDTKVPTTYLSKVMLDLVRAGLVTSQRGPGGGFSLAHNPEELTIWDAIEAVEPFQRIRSCPLGIEEHGPSLCPLHRRLDDAMAAAEETFRASRISDLLESGRGIKPLCEAEES